MFIFFCEGGGVLYKDYAGVIQGVHRVYYGSIYGI